MKIYATLARFIRDSTVAGRALLTAATKADQRAALELGTAAQSASSDFAAAVHTHDDRYYTEAETDSLLTSYLTVSTAGTTYQPLDSDLTAIAALTTTTFGRSLLTQADATAARSTFGLGTLATQNGTITDYLTIASAASTYLTTSTAASTYLPLAGGTLTGKLITAASTSGGAGFCIPVASAVASSPGTGDMYVNTAGTALFVCLNGAYRNIANLTTAQSWSSVQTFLTSSTGNPSIVIPHGSAPSAPANGGVWSTTAGLFMQVNGTAEQFCTLTNSVTLTNKTLTAPIISTISNTGTITLPTSTTTLIGRDTTDTVTNKRIQHRIVVATTATSLTPDISAADFYEYTALASALTINNPTGTPVNGELLNFRLQDNGTGRALTWGAQFRSMTATLPTTTVANKTHRVLCEWNSGDSTWDCLAVSAQP